MTSSAVRAFVRGALLGSILLGLCPADGRAQEPPSSLSTHGLPGLVVTPVVGTLPPGRFTLGANNFPDFDVFWSGPSFTLGQQYNGFLAFNLFSRVSFGVRVSDRRPREPQPMFFVAGASGLTAFPIRHIDLSPNAQVLLMPERQGLPGVALGAYDLTGTGLLETRYLVATKSLGSTVRFSAGFGVGPDLLDGPFGGVAWSPAPWGSLKGEWDGARVNAGILLRGELPGALGRHIPLPEAQVFWAQGKGWYWGGALGLPWDGDLSDRARTSRAAVTGERGAAASWGTPRELLDALAELGLENVAVAVSDTMIRVRYEDRVHLQNALDGLRRVLGLVAGEAGMARRGAEITVLSSERPVLRVLATPAALQAFGGAEVDPASGSPLRIDYPHSSPAAGAEWWRAPGGRSSRGKADLIVRPTLATHLAWEKGLADVRLGWMPTLEVQAAPGLSAALGYDVPLWQSEGIGITRGPLPKASVGLALLSYVWNRPLSPASALALHSSGGRFNPQREGLRQEVALLLQGGRLRLDADLAATRWVGGEAPPTGVVVRDRTSTLGIVRVRWLFPAERVRVGASAGRYLYGDWGWTGELSRDFGDTRLAFTLRHSRFGDLGVFTVSLPLGGERGLHPGRLRPRLPSVWRHSQNSRLFTGAGNYVAFDIAEELQTGFEGWDRFLDRDRLHPAAVAWEMTHPRFPFGR